MLKDIWEYTRGLVRHWKAFVTGLSVLLFTIWWDSRGAELTPAVWIVLGAVGILPASYLTWRDMKRLANDLASQAERILLSKPRLEVENFASQSIPEFGEEWRFEVANHGEVADFWGEVRIFAQDGQPVFSHRTMKLAWGRSVSQRRAEGRVTLGKGEREIIRLVSVLEGVGLRWLLFADKDGAVGRAGLGIPIAGQVMTLELEVFSDPAMSERWVRSLEVTDGGVRDLGR